MKKRIILIVLALALVIGAVAGGITYAQMEHPQMTGSKLFTQGPVGEIDLGIDSIRYETRLGITNPDCKHPIYIDHLSILYGNGTSLYEGDLYHFGGIGIPNQKVTSLQPHETVSMRLSQWTDGIDAPAQGYTVEVFYTAWRKGLPLVGTVFTERTNYFGDGTSTFAISQVQMENMTQNR